MAVSVKDVTNKPSAWRVGGVPILSMMDSHPKSGYKRTDLVVPSQEVNMNDTPYQKFKAAELRWRYIDHYSNPGPIQYKD